MFIQLYKKRWYEEYFEYQTNKEYMCVDIAHTLGLYTVQFCVLCIQLVTDTLL